MFDIRYGEEVKCTKDVVRDNYLLVKQDMVGKVIAMRLGEDKSEGYLVKWKGKSSPVAVTRKDIERVKT